MPDPAKEAAAILTSALSETPDLPPEPPRVMTLTRADLRKGANHGEPTLFGPGDFTRPREDWQNASLVLYVHDQDDEYTVVKLKDRRGEPGILYNPGTGRLNDRIRMGWEDGAVWMNDPREPGSRASMQPVVVMSDGCYAPAWGWLPGDEEARLAPFGPWDDTGPDALAIGFGATAKAFTQLQAYVRGLREELATLVLETAATVAALAAELYQGQGMEVKLAGRVGDVMAALLVTGGHLGVKLWEPEQLVPWHKSFMEKMSTSLRQAGYWKVVLAEFASAKAAMRPDSTADVKEEDILGLVVNVMRGAAEEDSAEDPAPTDIPAGASRHQLGEHLGHALNKLGFLQGRLSLVLDDESMGRDEVHKTLSEVGKAAMEVLSELQGMNALLHPDGRESWRFFGDADAGMLDRYRVVLARIVSDQPGSDAALVKEYVLHKPAANPAWQWGPIPMGRTGDLVGITHWRPLLAWDEGANLLEGQGGEETRAIQLETMMPQLVRALLSPSIPEEMLQVAEAVAILPGFSTSPDHPERRCTVQVVPLLSEDDPEDEGREFFSVDNHREHLTGNGPTYEQALVMALGAYVRWLQHEAKDQPEPAEEEEFMSREGGTP